MIDSEPSPAALTEDEIISGYLTLEETRGEPTRTEACACGGAITAPVNDELRTRFAIRHHQSTLRHQLWWAQS